VGDQRGPCGQPGARGNRVGDPRAKVAAEKKQTQDYNQNIATLQKS